MLKGGSTALAYESGASLLTNGNLDKVDLADVGISSVTGGFWTGVFFGALVDVNVDGNVASIGGVIGDEKSAIDMGIDVGAGVLGKGLEFGLEKAADNLLSQSDELLDAVGSLRVGNDKNTRITNNETVNSGTNHFIGKLESSAKVLRNTGTVIGKTAAKSADALTPALQKWYGLLNFNSELND